MASLIQREHQQLPALSGNKKKKKRKITSFGQPTSLIAMHILSAQVALHPRVVAQKAQEVMCCWGRTEAASHLQNVVLCHRCNDPVITGVPGKV